MERIKRVKKLYNNIFLVGSVLHAGNAVEYFIPKTKKLVVFYFLGSLRQEKDFIQVYQNGKLIKEKKLFAPRIPLIYHGLIYFAYIKSLGEYFNKRERIFVISFHPLFFLFGGLIRLFRNIVTVFWIADFLPKPSSLLLSFYQQLIFYLHKKNDINFYLGDKLNKLMNGKLINTQSVKTVMWGICLEKNKQKEKPKKLTLGFIGVVRKGHGLDLAFQLLKTHKNMHIKILGECSPSLFTYYQTLIKSYAIEKQVLFENRFYTMKELKKELSECTVGIGLYNTSKDDPIYYTDPGKIKTYTQFGLPVIITNTSEIVPYVKKYKAGEITSSNVKSFYSTIQKINRNYEMYLKGVENFNNFFEYKNYYDKAFVALRT